MRDPLVLLLGLLTVGFCGAGFLTPRVRAGNLALAGGGAAAASLLFLSGHLGLGIAVAGVLWSVAGSAQGMARLLDEVEARQRRQPAREPWIVALLTAGTLTLSLALATAAVDWPESRPVSPDRPIAARETTLLSLLALSAVAALFVLRTLHRGEELEREGGSGDTSV